MLHVLLCDKEALLTLLTESEKKNDFLNLVCLCKAVEHLYKRLQCFLFKFAFSPPGCTMCCLCVFTLCAVKETDTHKLWKNIEPHLKKAMQTVYLREVSRCVCVFWHCSTLPLCLCVFSSSSPPPSLSPLVSLQWEQMQQAEEECAAPRGVDTLAQPRCSAVKRKRGKKEKN